MAWYWNNSSMTLGDSYDPGFDDEPYNPDLYDKEPEPKSDKERISDLEKIVEELQRKLKGR